MKRYSRLLCVILVLIICMSLCVAPTLSAATYYVEKDFLFTKSTTNQITICGYQGSETAITIPTTLLGYTAEYIGKDAFVNQSTLTSITIGDNIKSIGQSAFYGCTSLKSIVIPENCALTGPHIFYGCTSLESVTLPTNMTKVYPQFFNKCKSLTEIVLPDTVEEIGKYAFANCDNLEAVYIPRNIISIDSTAFKGSPHAAIFGYLGTYAHTFARENGIAFYAIDQVETFKATYYNYDGSIYWITDVAKNGIAQPPATPPEKPSTLTHYYEFSLWEGNAVNIQQDEDFYPVFTEHEIPEGERPQLETFYVIFLNGDNTLLSAQSVLKGTAAVTPQQVPSKADLNGKYYLFTGWDKSFDNVQENLIIYPEFSEHTKIYNVSFYDSDGKHIASYSVEHGNACPTPDYIPTKASDDEYSYTFTGWDKDYSSVTSDLTLTPVFEKTPHPTTPEKPDTPEVPVMTTGNLKIEITAGRGFTVAFGDGPARVQGPSYYNSSAPIGTKATVTALPSSGGGEFIGWVNTTNGLILTTNETYSFYTSGNDFFKAMYKTDIEGVKMVIFMHDKASQQLDVQYYSSADSIQFPSVAPQMLGYSFTGWDMTEAEIQAEIAKGNDVTVLPVWEKVLTYVDVTVEGGTADGTRNDMGQFLMGEAVTVTAAPAEAGKKFAYWTDASGNVKSYNESYTFFLTGPAALTAVFIGGNADIDYQVLLSVDNFTPGDYGTFTVTWFVPEKYEFVGGGIIAVNKDLYNESTFVHGSTDTNVWDRTGSDTLSDNTFNWTGPVFSGQTWYAKCWAQYKDESGVLKTVYSDMFTAVKD